MNKEQDLTAQYLNVWDLKKPKWPGRVEESYVRVRDWLINKSPELTSRSLESDAFEVCKNMFDPLSNIFIQQLRTPNIGDISWLDLAPNLGGELANTCSKIRGSAEYLRLVNRSPLYAKVVNLIEQSMAVSSVREAEKLNNQAAIVAQHLAKEKLPVIFTSLGQYYSKHWEPDVRLILPVDDPDYREIEQDLQFDLQRLAGRKTRNYNPGIVGNLIIGAGSALASISSGQALEGYSYLLCTNRFSSLEQIRNKYTELGLAFDVNKARAFLTILYGAHESAHNYFRSSKKNPILDELLADVPSLEVVITRRQEIIKLLPGLTLNDMRLMILGEYQIAIDAGKYNDPIWDGYYYSAKSIKEDMEKCGLADLRIQPTEEQFDEFVKLLRIRRANWTLWQES